MASASPTRSGHPRTRPDLRVRRLPSPSGAVCGRIGPLRCRDHLWIGPAPRPWTALRTHPPRIRDRSEDVLASARPPLGGSGDGVVTAGRGDGGAGGGRAGSGAGPDRRRHPGPGAGRHRRRPAAAPGRPRSARAPSPQRRAGRRRRPDLDGPPAPALAAAAGAGAGHPAAGDQRPDPGAGHRRPARTTTGCWSCWGAATSARTPRWWRRRCGRWIPGPRCRGRRSWARPGPGPAGSRRARRARRSARPGAAG